jgi:hypothetical protein
MVFTAALEMSRPSCDDRTAMMALYGGGNSGRFGALTGRVTAPSGGAIFGAHVQAIQLERGVVMSSGITDRDGSFRIAGLEPGTYTVEVEPYYPGSSALSPYYGGINPGACNGSMFQRTFASTGGVLRTTNVSGGGTGDIGSIGVSCQAPGSINSSAENAFYSSPTIAPANLNTPVATSSSFSTTSSHYYRLVGQTGTLSAHVIGFTLYSRPDVQVQFFDSNGTPLSSSTAGNVFSASASGYVNYDSETTVNLTTPRDVIVRVWTEGTLPTSVFPSASMGLSNTPYYVLTLSRGGPANPAFDLNARCESPDAFGPYPNQGEAPPMRSVDDRDGGSSGCGTLQGVDHDPMGPGGLVRLVNFAMVLAMLVIARRYLAKSGEPKFAEVQR